MPASKRPAPPRVSAAPGRLNLVWGDPPSGAPHLRYFLVDERDPRQRTELPPEEAPASDTVAPVRWSGRRVSARRAPGRIAAGPSLAAVAADAAATPGISGVTPWVNLLCKFADVAAEYHGLDPCRSACRGHVQLLRARVQ
jgi:hypothetical protein